MCGSVIAQNFQELTKEPGVPSPPPELRLAFQVHLKMWKGQIKKFSEDEIDANAFFQGCAPDRRVLGGKPRARVEKLGDEVEKEEEQSNFRQNTSDGKNVETGDQDGLIRVDGFNIGQNKADSDRTRVESAQEQVTFYPSNRISSSTTLPALNETKLSSNF